MLHAHPVPQSPLITSSPLPHPSALAVVAALLCVGVALGAALTTPQAPPPSSAPSGQALFQWHAERPHPNATPESTVDAQFARLAQADVFQSRAWSTFGAFMRQAPRRGRAAQVVWREDARLSPLVNHTARSIHLVSASAARAVVAARVVGADGAVSMFTVRMSRDAPGQTACARCWRVDDITRR